MRVYEYTRAFSKLCKALGLPPQDYYDEWTCKWYFHEDCLLLELPKLEAELLQRGLREDESVSEYLARRYGEEIRSAVEKMIK